MTDRYRHLTTNLSKRYDRELIMWLNERKKNHRANVSGLLRQGLEILKATDTTSSSHDDANHNR